MAEVVWEAMRAATTAAGWGMPTKPAEGSLVAWMAGIGELALRVQGGVAV